MIDMTKSPPTITFNDHVMENHLSLLKRGEPDEYGDSTYDYRKLQDFTLELMHFASVSYQSAGGDGVTRPLSEFSAEERRLYYPFAFMLACIDGNAFRTGQLNPIFADPDAPPSEESISQYIPNAWKIIRANSGDLDEVRGMIAAAGLGESE